MNIFATVLTYPAPSANYRGESEENRSVIQKVTHGRFEYPIISPEAMRNALREILTAYRLPYNRTRVEGTAGDEKDQLRVRFSEYPQPEKFADDFFFGYLLAVKEADRKKVKQAMGKEYPIKRDSVLRMNLARSLEPYRHDALFTQSPLNFESPWKNAEQSALLHRETVVTAFQYPFALNLFDCSLDDKGKSEAKTPDGKAYPTKGDQHKDWLCHLLRAISELNGVAGNHARSYFEMAPASIVLRLTDSLVAGYETYGFKPDGGLPEVVDGVLHGDYPGNEFYLGGQIVKNVLNHNSNKNLKAKGVNLFRMANEALSAVARKVCGAGFLEKEREWEENADAAPSA